MSKEPKKETLKERKARLTKELNDAAQLRQRAADAHQNATLRMVELQAQLKLLSEIDG